MRQNRVKDVMGRGQLAIGGYVSLADPQVVEIIGLAGFDAAFIDMEHTGFELGLVGEMIRAADLVGVTSIVRVPDNDAKLILRILDMGAEGIIIPHVDGVEGAKQAVAAVRYAPLGDRGGAAGTRAARYGTVPWRDHVRESNAQFILSVKPGSTPRGRARRGSVRTKAGRCASIFRERGCTLRETRVRSMWWAIRKAVFPRKVGRIWTGDEAKS